MKAAVWIDKKKLGQKEICTTNPALYDILLRILGYRICGIDFNIRVGDVSRPNRLKFLEMKYLMRLIRPHQTAEPQACKPAYTNHMTCRDTHRGEFGRPRLITQGNLTPNTSYKVRTYHNPALLAVSFQAPAKAAHKGA
jgi:hypothetical protein